MCSWNGSSASSSSCCTLHSDCPRRGDRGESGSDGGSGSVITLPTRVGLVIGLEHTQDAYVGAVLVIALAAVAGKEFSAFRAAEGEPTARHGAFGRFRSRCG
jgi:hypothetical protein